MISKELEIKCPSGATIFFTGDESGESFKALDGAKLTRALGEYNNTDHGKDFEEFDLFEKQPKMKKQYSSKQRKIHKLKRDNVVLGQKRNCYLKRFNCKKFVHTLGHVNPIDCEFDLREIKTIFNLSEKIGKNSAKIQRLRTQIQQEKALDKL